MEQQYDDLEDIGDSKHERSLQSALWRGAKGKCPSCGTGKMFGSYLKVNDSCPHCNEELHHHRADDAPPYFTILILGHILVPLLISVESAYTPPLWLHAVIWIPVTIILALTLLQIAKGATIGLQWAYYMHGFGDEESEDRFT